jgi:hypothetical protein
MRDRGGKRLELDARVLELGGSLLELAANPAQLRTLADLVRLGGDFCNAVSHSLVVETSDA